MALVVDTMWMPCKPRGPLQFARQKARMTPWSLWIGMLIRYALTRWMHSGLERPVIVYVMEKLLPSYGRYFGWWRNRKFTLLKYTVMQHLYYGLAQVNGMLVSMIRCLWDSEQYASWYRLHGAIESLHSIMLKLIAVLLETSWRILSLSGYGMEDSGRGSHHELISSGSMELIQIYIMRGSTGIAQHVKMNSHQGEDSLLMQVYHAFRLLCHRGWNFLQLRILMRWPYSNVLPTMPTRFDMLEQYSRCDYKLKGKVSTYWDFRRQEHRAQ